MAQNNHSEFELFTEGKREEHGILKYDESSRSNSNQSKQQSYQDIVDQEPEAISQLDKSDITDAKQVKGDMLYYRTTQEDSTSFAVPGYKGEAQPVQTDKILETQNNLHGQRDIDAIRIVVVGKTGSGKSAVGNFMMAEEHFESKISGQSVTKECKKGISRATGRKLVIVDTTGLFDTQIPYEKISQEIIRCIHMSLPGPHVFLLVVPITRITDEEIQTFHRLFDLFGEQIENFAITTFTRLDDLQRGKITIETYIESLPSMLRTFLQRCKGRYFAFDNSESNQNVRIAKTKTLIKMIDDIRRENGDKHYTNGMYIEAEAHLQQKVREAERKKALEKEREIKEIETKYEQTIEDTNKKKCPITRANSTKRIEAD